MAHTHGGVILLPISFAHVQTGLHEPPCSRKEVVDTKVCGAKEERKRRYRKSEKEGKKNMINSKIQLGISSRGVNSLKKRRTRYVKKSEPQFASRFPGLTDEPEIEIEYGYNNWLNRHKIKQAEKRLEWQQEQEDKFFFMFHLKFDLNEYKKLSIQDRKFLKQQFIEKKRKNNDS